MRKILLLLCICIFVTGCASIRPFNVKINSIKGDQMAEGHKCIIYPGLKDVSVNDLQFSEYANYLERALNKKGITIVKNPDEADSAVFLSYGIGDPQKHTYSYSVPIYGQTGVSSSTTFGTVSTLGNMGTFSGTTINTPSYGIVGATSNIGSYVIYTRFIGIVAYDLNLYRESKTEKQLWKTDIVSTGSTGDLRTVFPILMGAAYPYIGEDTGKQVKVILTESDKKVKYIKGLTAE